LRQTIYLQLDARAREKPGLSPANKLLDALIVAAVLLAILGTEEPLRKSAETAFSIADLMLGVIFTVEYLVRVWSAGENPKYAGVRGRVRYVFSIYAIIDLVAILPFVLTIGGYDAFVLRLVRLLRLVAIAKLGRYSTALQNIATAIRDRGHELLLSFGAALLVMILAAAVLHISERSANPESFGSIPRALWWGLATISKVGYGGAFPVTIAGKMFAGVFAIASVAVVAMPVGILAAAFSEAFQKERRAKRDG
jgi:voltage-gated potassium channel